VTPEKSDIHDRSTAMAYPSFAHVLYPGEQVMYLVATGACET